MSRNPKTRFGQCIFTYHIMSYHMILYQIKSYIILYCMTLYHVLTIGWSVDPCLSCIGWSVDQLILWYRKKPSGQEVGAKALVTFFTIPTVHPSAYKMYEIIYHMYVKYHHTYMAIVSSLYHGSAHPPQTKISKHHPVTPIDSPKKKPTTKSFMWLRGGFDFAEKNSLPA